MQFKFLSFIVAIILCDWCDFTQSEASFSIHEHDDLSGALEAYLRFHYTSMKDSGTRNISTSTYVLWHGYHGAASQLQSLVSAFLFAMCTGRVLLAQSDMLHYLKSPFVIGGWGSTHVARFRSDFSRQTLYVHHHNTVDTFASLRCANLTEVYSSVIVEFSGNMWIAPLLAENPFLRQTLHHLFPHQQFYSHLARLLIRPSDELEGILSGIVERSFESGANSERSVVGLLIPPDSMIAKDFTQILHCLEITNAWSPEYVRIFIASAHPTFVHIARKKLGHERVVHLRRSSTVQSVQRHLLDYFLLANHCKAGVVTVPFSLGTVSMSHNRINHGVFIHAHQCEELRQGIEPQFEMSDKLSSLACRSKWKLSESHT